MTARRRRSGHALLAVTAFLAIAMLLWLAAFASLSSNVRAAKALQIQGDRDDGATRALAWALTLLETGYPPGDEYACRATLDSGPAFVFSYERMYEDTFDVSVRPAEAADASLPRVPTRFNSGEGND